MSRRLFPLWLAAVLAAMSGHVRALPADRAAALRSLVASERTDALPVAGSARVAATSPVAAPRPRLAGAALPAPPATLTPPCFHTSPGSECGTPAVRPVRPRRAHQPTGPPLLV